MHETVPATPEARALFDTAPGGIISFDGKGVLHYVNATLARYLRIESPETLPGRSVETLLTLPTRIFFQTHFLPLLRLHGEASEIFLTFAASDGEQVPVVANAARQPDEPDRYWCIALPVYRRQQLEQELVAARRRAEEALHSDSTLDALRSTLQSHEALLDRRMARLEQRNEELRQLNWLLAHDLQEPLRKIQLFASLLEQRGKNAPETEERHFLQRIVDNVVTVSELLGDVQRYTGLDLDDLGAGAITSVQPVEVIKRVARNLRMIYADRDWTLLLEENVPAIDGNEHQLELLFYHLLENALKFHDGSGPAHVHIEAAVVEHNQYRSLPETYRYTDFIRFVVRDNGPGFDESSLRHNLLFRLLKKADRSTPGSGIGLALCKKIVSNHYGFISAANARDGGAEVTVWLPLRS